MPELTKESRKVLKSIYDAYLSRRKNNQSKMSAIHFTDADTKCFDGFTDAKNELQKSGYIKSDIIGNFDLTDKAIIFMENFTKETIVKWLEFGSGFIP